MNNRFFAEHKVGYYNVRPDLRLDFPWLMSMMQETSVRHTESTPQPMEWFRVNRMGFVLTNWQVKVLKCPRLNDTLTIYTWPVDFKGITCERYFEVHDAVGAVVAWANSKWVYMDFNKRRPVKPTEEIIAGYRGMFPAGFDSDYTFPKIDCYKKIGTDRFTVTRRDIDSNSHVNNTKYIEWAADFIPDRIYDTGFVTDVKAVYKKECQKGQAVVIETYMNEENRIISLIKADEEPDITLAELYFKLTALS